MTSRPTLIIAAQNDNIAPVAQHAKPFYNSIATSVPKMYVELAGAGHNVTNSANTTQAQFEIAFLKRFLDNDTRYTQFLCGISTAQHGVDVHEHLPVLVPFQGSLQHPVDGMAVAWRRPPFLVSDSRSPASTQRPDSQPTQAGCSRTPTEEAS